MEQPPAGPIEQLYEHVLDPFTEGFGLAESTPRRFLFFAGVAAVGLWLYKPDSMFKPDGSQRQAKFIEGGSDATPITWWAASLTVGTAAALFL